MDTTKYSNADHYVDPQTGVLKNRLGITSEEELEKAEADFAAARAFELANLPRQNRFDFDQLRAIHRHLFQDLYDWAGQPRDIDIAKGGNVFAHHVHIQTCAATLFEALGRENALSGLDKDAFSNRAAHYLGELNALHPFREGNGRAQREFINQLAFANGYWIAWQEVDAAELLEASIEAFKGDATKLTQIIRRAIKMAKD